MNTVRDLSDLATRAQRRSAYLRSRAGNLQAKQGKELDAVLTSTVVDAAGLWGSFLRAYFLSIANGAWNRSGVKLTFALAFPTQQDAIKFALVKYGKQVPAVVTARNEPPWHFLPTYFKVFKDAGASNLAAFNAAFGHQTLFFDYLTQIRNFYAHRCESTFNKAAKLGIELGVTSRLNLHPNVTLTYRAPNSACEVITDWLYDMDLVIEDLCA